MKTLELKHIAPYLPYGLKVILGTTERDLTSISLDSHFVFVSAWKGSREKQMASIESIKPILRPLSDLDKNITHNGKTFNPVKELVKMPITKENNALMAFYGLNTIGVGKYLEDVADYGSINPKYLSYPLATKLMEWHFDIYGLIEKGLAVDINELNNKIMYKIRQTISDLMAKEGFTHFICHDITARNYIAYVLDELGYAKADGLEISDDSISFKVKSSEKTFICPIKTEVDNDLEGSTIHHVRSNSENTSKVTVTAHEGVQIVEDSNLIININS